MFWANVLPPPLAKNWPYAYEQIEQSFSRPNIGHLLMSVSFFLLLFFTFQISTKLRELSYFRDESKVFLTRLAEQVEDFSVTLMDQISRKEGKSIKHDENNDMDTYASLLDSITESAIRFQQKKVLRIMVYRHFKVKDTFKKCNSHIRADILVFCCSTTVL